MNLENWHWLLKRARVVCTMQSTNWACKKRKESVRVMRERRAESDKEESTEC